MERLTGKKLLIVGVCDDRKKFVFDQAAQYGIQCCSLGTVHAELIQDKVARCLHYNIYSHTNDEEHRDAIVDLVRKEFGDVDGCVTFWDASTPLTALLCERLGKPGIPYSGALAANKKSLTIEQLRFSSPTSGKGREQYSSRCCHIASLDDLEKSSHTVGFPAVLKSEYGSGGMSAKVVRDIEESRKHFSFLQSLQVESDRQLYLGTLFGKDCVLMELLEGSEHSVDMTLFHGELVCAFITDKGTRSAQDVTVHATSVMPSLLTSEKQCQIIRAGFECCRHLGLDHGVFNLDLILTRSGPKLVEINARMAGFCHRDFILRCYNVDLVHLAVQLACDVKPDIPVHHTSVPLMADRSTDGISFSDSRQHDSQGPPRYFTPKPSCVIVGRAVYAWQHGSALRSIATPEILQQLHDEGKLLFFPHETRLRMQRYEMPFCTLAVSSHSFSDAIKRLDSLCQNLGLEPVQTSFHRHVQTAEMAVNQ